VLGRLRSCKVDTLKIDRSFVNEIGSEAGDTIVRALVSIGRSLDLTVVAEGIETKNQHELLRRLGCPMGQGYLFARPVTAAAVADLARYAATLLSA
jgi:EAL domain-containing protein (putative c-di-GMP-specific phosphodiesterase class I)